MKLWLLSIQDEFDCAGSFLLFPLVLCDDGEGLYGLSRICSGWGRGEGVERGEGGKEVVDPYWLREATNISDDRLKTIWKG